MIAVHLNDLELTTFTSHDYPTQKCAATFPLFGAHGSKQLATVYFELEPGAMLGRHTDSAEDLLVILDGQVKATIGDETRTTNAGGLILVPEMVPHQLVNTGTTRARVLGVFGGANHIVATFDEIWHPIDTNIVDTSKM